MSKTPLGILNENLKEANKLGVRMSAQKLGMLVLMFVLTVPLVLISGCVGQGDATPENPVTQIVKDITPEEAYALIQANKDNPDFVIIDMQRTSEHEERHIENAIHLFSDSPNFRNELAKFDKNKTYLVYCRFGASSGSAARQMKKLGFMEVYTMSYGGLHRWESEGFPVVE